MTKANIDESTRMEGELDGVNPQLITVGRHCVIGQRAALLTHCPIRGAKPVTIGNCVWIGYGAIVLPGVTIGNCCVIGAGAVVTHDVGSGSIVAGVPARFLRYLTDEEMKTLVYNLQNGLPMSKEQKND